MKKFFAFILSLVMVSMLIVPMASAEGTFYHVFKASEEYGDEPDYVVANPILVKLHQDAGYMWYILEIDEGNWIVFCNREDGFNVLIKDAIKLENGTILIPKKLDGMKKEGIFTGEDDFYNLVYDGLYTEL